MYDFEEALETTASPEDVWAIWSDVPGWPRWHPVCETVAFAGPFESGAEGMVTVSSVSKVDFDAPLVDLAREQTIAIHFENVRPHEGFDAVWKRDPAFSTRITHTVERIPTGARFKHKFHAGGLLAIFSFLTAAAAHARIKGELEMIAALAEERARTRIQHK